MTVFEQILIVMC